MTDETKSRLEKARQERKEQEDETDIKWTPSHKNYDLVFDERTAAKDYIAALEAALAEAEQERDEALDALKPFAALAVGGDWGPASRTWSQIVGRARDVYHKYRSAPAGADERVPAGGAQPTEGGEDADVEEVERTSQGQQDGDDGVHRAGGGVRQTAETGSGAGRPVGEAGRSGASRGESGELIKDESDRGGGDTESQRSEGREGGSPVTPGRSQDEGAPEAWPESVGQSAIAVSGIWLRRDGGENEVGRVIVSVDINGRWVDVISEVADGAFSHIVEPLGIRGAIRRKIEREPGEIRRLIMDTGPKLPGVDPDKVAEALGAEQVEQGRPALPPEIVQAWDRTDETTDELPLRILEERDAVRDALVAKDAELARLRSDWKKKCKENAELCARVMRRTEEIERLKTRIRELGQLPGRNAYDEIERLKDDRDFIAKRHRALCDVLWDIWDIPGLTSGVNLSEQVPKLVADLRAGLERLKARDKEARDVIHLYSTKFRTWSSLEDRAKRFLAEEE